jgi:hypothetical protein
MGGNFLAANCQEPFGFVTTRIVLEISSTLLHLSRTPLKISTISFFDCQSQGFSIF